MVTEKSMRLNMTQSGRFETHLTLAAVNMTKPSDEDRMIVRQWAANRKLKWTHILLSSGQHASQPMISYQQSGTLEIQKQTAFKLCQELNGLNEHVVRVKIEAHIDNACVPSHFTHETAKHADELYFEHHVKLCLNQQTNIDALRQIAEHHDARISANARRVRSDGNEERFLTQRVFRAGRDQAQEVLRDLLTELRNKEFAILEIESEYVVFDSNLPLDDGWK